MAPPSKPDSSNPLISLFKSLGLSQAKAAEAAKSPKSAAILKELIEKYSLVSDQGGLDEKHANLVVALSGSLTKSESIGDAEQKYIIDKILEDKLKSVDQVSGASPSCCYLFIHLNLTSIQLRANTLKRIRRQSM